MAINCGLDCPNLPDLFTGLSEVDRLQYSFVCIPIVHPRLRRSYNPGGSANTIAFCRSDMLLDPGDWTNRIVARTSPYINVDTLYSSLRQQHEDMLVEELNHCKGLGISTILFTLHGSKNNNLARIVINHLHNSHFNPGFWVQVPLENPSLRAFGKDGSELDHEDTWNWWSTFHRLTEWDRRISLALKLSADLPSDEDILRWLGEPIKCLIIPTDVFLTNRKGYPVLSKPHQSLVRKLLDRDVQLMVTGVCRHQDTSHYVKYLQHLLKESAPSMDPMTNYAKGWEDYLQTPLQPLSDNLDSYTYNVFEKDPVKYDRYQSAICEALKSRYNTPITCTCGKEPPIEAKIGAEEVNDDKNKSAQSNGIPENEYPLVDNLTKPIENSDTCTCKHSSVVMVLGAGRGPLVRATLNAAELANVNVKVYAVEKNPTALVTLHAQQRDMWHDRVTVIANDMRKFKPEHLADIIVSELLGSFGDNELSPECLDGARHLLKDDGISIPYSYSSFISPVMCPRLWGLARASKRETALTRGSMLAHPLETPWVVYLQNKYEIAPPKELFTFEHPCEAGDGDHVERRRWKCIKFPVSKACNLHGFSGYFSCILFKEHTLSIVPETHSDGMISWFPIFFPIKNPILLKADDEVEINFWRCSNDRKVWYEWNVTSPEIQFIHNTGGRSSDMIL